MLFHYHVRQYYLYQHATDMRKGIDALCGMVHSELKQNPLTGDLFIFINGRKNQLKILHWQRDGFAIFYKRLEKGTYEFPALNSDSVSLEISSQQLLLILDGVSLLHIKKRSRFQHDFVQKYQ